MSRRKMSSPLVALAIFLLAFGALASSGCPALIVPSLAYQGYKYTKGKSETQKSATSSKSNSRSQSDNVE